MNIYYEYIYKKKSYNYIFFFQISFFQGKPTPYEQCKNMLEIWAEEDVDASMENLAYILEGLKFTEALAILKS